MLVSICCVLVLAHLRTSMLCFGAGVGVFFSRDLLNSPDSQADLSHYFNLIFTTCTLVSL